MFDGHVHLTIVPELADLFLERKQDSVQCFLKWNNRHCAVQALFKDDTIEGI